MVILDKDLVLYLPFSEGSGTKVYDRSIRQNHGTVTGAIFLRPYEDMSNDSDDEGDNPNVIYDDDETFWVGQTEGSGGFCGSPTLSEELTEVKKGVSSLKIVVGAGSATHWRFRHDWAGEDFSYYDYFSFWWYGLNKNKPVSVFMGDGVSEGYWNFTENFSGWRRVIFILQRNSNYVNIDWTAITFVLIRQEGDDAPTSQGTWYFDRTSFDVGNWRFGKCLDYDGTNDYVEVLNDTSLQLSSIYTISLWINRKSDSGSDERLIAKSSNTDLDYYIHIRDVDTIRIGHTDAGGSSHYLDGSRTISIKEWHHIVGIYEEGVGFSIYIDGILDASGISVGDINSPSRISTVNLWFGRLLATYNFDGIISEVRIYNRALSSEEIRTLYNEKRVN